MKEVIIGILAVLIPTGLTVASKAGQTRRIGAAMLIFIREVFGKRAKRAVQLTLLDLAYGDPETSYEIKKDILSIEERIKLSDTSRL